MSSVSATHLILFIASLVLAVAIAGTLVMEVGHMSTAIENRGSSVAEDIGTEVEIVNDEGAPHGMYDSDNDNDNLTVLVKNVGSESLPVDERAVDLLIDGGYVPNNDIHTVERVDVVGSDTWRPGGVVEVTIDVGEKDIEGDTSITVITDGSEDSIHVYIDDGDDD